MSVDQTPTLSDWHQIQNHELPRESLGHMIQVMQITGFHRWGFLVYRCTYSDDDAWQRYMQHFHECVRAGLEYYGRDVLLFKYLELIVVDERDTLDGATKSQVREKFRQWSATHREPDQGGPGSTNPFAKRIPMFSFCVHVDQLCLDRFKVYEDWEANGKQGLAPHVPCAIIDAGCDHEGRGSGGYPNIEGCLKEYPGWMYADVGSIPEIYNKVNHEGLEAGFDYSRPPLVFPD